MSRSEGGLLVIVASCGAQRVERSEAGKGASMATTVGYVNEGLILYFPGGLD